MPTRIIREGIITSEAVNSLSAHAELFYRRLMSVADDYGRFHSHPSLLRGACYPYQLDRVSDKDISKWLAECVNAKLIFIYSEGKCLQIVKFGQQCRSRSKFPEHSESELLIKCISNDSHLLTESLRGPTTYTPSTSSPTPTPNGFTRPSIDEVKLMGAKAGMPDSESEKFFHHYESNGWRVGKNPMRSLAGAIGGWVARWREGQCFGPNGKPVQPKADYSKGF